MNKVREIVNASTRQATQIATIRVANEAKFLRTCIILRRRWLIRSLAIADEDLNWFGCTVTPL